MQPADYFWTAIYFMVPVLLMVWWIRMKSGIDKRWFVIPASPLISRNFYFFLPAFVLGSTIGLIGVLLVILDPYANPNLIIIAFGFYGVGFILAYFEPDWLAPNWYRWLKREHGDIMPYLAMDAHEMGRQAWMQRVETQEGLEEWAAEVRQKYRL